MPKGKVPRSGERLLTPEEVAPRLGTTPRGVRERIKRGQLPAVKMGRYNRVKESDLETYIASRPRRTGKGTAR